MNENTWIEQSLVAEGIKLTGGVEKAHVRPWSTVLRVPTDVGDVFFKAVAPAFAFEPEITWAIQAWQPGSIPRVFAIDGERRWMLTADGGQTLREAFGNGLNLRTWDEVLARHAALQIELAGQVEEMVALGVRDRRLARLPALYKWLLADREWLLIDQTDGLSSEEYERLVRAIPEVKAMCQELAAFSIPESLHHNDLHDANVFHNDGKALFFDWGDSSIAHPFFSLRTVFVSIENSFGLEEDDPVFDEIARAYLRSWMRFESEETLWAAYQLARRLWSISSAVKYKTQMGEIEILRSEFAGAVPGLLQEFLDVNTQLDQKI